MAVTSKCKGGDFNTPSKKIKTAKAIQNHNKPSKPSLCDAAGDVPRWSFYVSCGPYLAICYILLWHDVSKFVATCLSDTTSKCAQKTLQIVWSTLGRSFKLDPQPSNSSFYKKQLGFNTKVNTGTFCYKCLCPTHWRKTNHMEYVFCTGPKT